MSPRAATVCLLKLLSPANSLFGAKAGHDITPDERRGYPGSVSERYSPLTVSRLRPLARRRLSTSRPFLVLMRTRNP